MIYRIMKNYGITMTGTNFVRDQPSYLLTKFEINLISGFSEEVI